MFSVRLLIHYIFIKHPLFSLFVLSERFTDSTHYLMVLRYSSDTDNPVIFHTSTRVTAIYTGECLVHFWDSCIVCTCTWNKKMNLVTHSFDKKGKIMLFKMRNFYCTGIYICAVWEADFFKCGLNWYFLYLSLVVV